MMHVKLEAQYDGEGEENNSYAMVNLHHTSCPPLPKHESLTKLLIYVGHWRLKPHKKFLSDLFHY